MGVAIEVAVEQDPFFRNLTYLAEAKDLEAARIGQDGSGPAHVFMEAAKVLN